MLASITPLGERGRHARWGLTVSAFLLGATTAGTAAGAGLGALGALVLPAGVHAHTRAVALAAALALAIALDVRPGVVPGPRRQVDERWLDHYRGWVYGLGYGWQLGLGVTTVVSSAATYVALLAAFLAGGAPAGALILGCFGAVRGVTPLATAHVRSQRQLLDLHRGLTRWRKRARWGAVAMQGGALLAAIAIAGL
jgi:hypothetical protein